MTDDKPNEELNEENQDLGNEEAQVETPAENNEAEKPNPQEKQTYVVARGGHIKHDGVEYFEGGKITDFPERLKSSIDRGYLITEAEFKENPFKAMAQADDKQGEEVRKGSEVETPEEEGALDEDGDSAEIAKPKKAKKGKKRSSRS